MMGRGFRLGRLYGINIRVDWSWLIILLLVTWNLTTVFGQLHPDWSIGLRWGLSLIASLLFFASVLAHELAHSLVARAYNIPVQSITLFLFGGVASIQREPPTPRSEFLIAAAGPGMSLLIGAAMLAVAFGSVALYGMPVTPGRIITGLSPAGTLSFWLGSINLILAIFNLIPGFPLDGGRVLRSILWAIMKNMRRATRVAAFIGRLIALLMITGGIAMALGFRLPLLGTGVFNGIWLALIGWFLNNASVQSYQQVALQEMLSGVPVSQVMQTNSVTVDPQWSLANLTRLPVQQKEDTAFPVLEADRLVGMVTFEDARRVPERDWNVTTVGDVMTPGPRLVTVSPDDDAASAMEKLMMRDVRLLPVVADGTQFIGMLGRRDILRWLKAHQ
jgi:Zn-dependent protease/predicted transcriptional regulator